MELSAGCDEGTGGVDKGPRLDCRAEALGERGDPQRETKTWLEEPAKLERVRDGYDKVGPSLEEDPGVCRTRVAPRSAYTAIR